MRLYGSGNLVKFSHVSGSVLNASRMSFGYTNSSLSIGSSDGRRNGFTFPCLISSLSRSLFGWEYVLPSRLGVNLWTFVFSSSRFTMLSIHPKQRASSTESL